MDLTLLVIISIMALYWVSTFKGFSGVFFMKQPSGRGLFLESPKSLLLRIFWYSYSLFMGSTNLFFDVFMS